MKTFNESMIKNYKEFNNSGEFEIEGYKVRFDLNTKTLNTNYPNKEDLRKWFFEIEEDEDMKTLTNEEIKKAWETMKKEIKKELGTTYGFTMNKKQIENRTATACICNNISYEREIAHAYNSIERIQAYDTWTEQEKADNKERNEQLIARYNEKLAQFGTKENEAITSLNQIENTKAYKKFVATMGGDVTMTIELKNDCYYIRFNY